jgi:NADPH:quinone reductase-like Zn-dependent oxidoreductase
MRLGLLAFALLLVSGNRAYGEHSGHIDWAEVPGAAGYELRISRDGEDVVKETRRLTGGRGAEIVLDAIGGPGFAELGGAAAEDGRMICYGWLDAQPALLPMQWPLTVHGYSNFALLGTAEGRRRAAHYVGSGLADGTLRPVVAEVFDGLDRIGDAHRLMESNRHTGKIVVRV